MPKPLTDQQRKLIAAINRGIGSIRDLQAAAGYSSTSVTKYNLKLLAERGEIVLLQHGTQQRVFDGSSSQLVLQALGGQPQASREELDEIRALLDSIESGKTP